MTLRGKRFLEKHEKKLNRHDYGGKFIDRVSREREQREKSNTLYDTAHDCIGGEPLGSTSETLREVAITEYPFKTRQDDKHCNVRIPKSVSHVQAGDTLYLRLNNTPLFLGKMDWLPVEVTKIVEEDSRNLYICRET